MTRDEWAALYERPETQRFIGAARTLQERDPKKYRFLVQAIERLWNDGISRRNQLDGYKVKRDQVKDAKRRPELGITPPKFRAYAPLEADERTRVEAKRRAAAQGVASDKFLICGHEGLDGRKCWLPPHPESVPHKF